MKQNHLIHFEDDDLKIGVNIEDETVWLTQTDICELFQKKKSTISYHITNIFKEDELDENAVVRKNRTTAADGKTYEVTYYNLDVIISVGYRVKSSRGIKFRKWANRILKDYLVNGYVVNISRLETENQKLKELQQIISFVHRVAIEGDVNGDEIINLLSVVKEYEFALDLLDRYDHKTLTIGNVTEAIVKVVSLDEVYEIIKIMKTEFTTDLFGKEKDKSLSSSIETIYQTAFGEDMYPSLEEKAS